MTLRTLARSTLWLALAALPLGCGEATPSREDSPTAAERPPAAPVEHAAPPAEPRPIASCRRGELVAIASDRARPEVVLAKDVVAIVHRSRRRATEEGAECPPHRVVSQTSLPMREGAFQELSTSPVCRWSEGGATFAVGAAAHGDALYTFECMYDSGARSGENDTDPWMTCSERRVGDEDRGTSQRIDIRADYGLVIGDAHTRFAHLDVAGFHVFAVAITQMLESSGVFASVRNDARAIPAGRIGFAPSGDVEDPAQFGFAAAPRPEGGFVLVHGPVAGSRRTRTTFDADGFSAGREIVADAFAPPPLDITVERVDRRTPPKLRLVREGVQSPLAGPSETEGAFGPSFARIGERLVLVWSEGLRSATRIRVAVVDPERAAVVGPIADLSTPGVEAGYASVAAHGDRLIAAWDERAGEGWTVVATELGCE